MSYHTQRPAANSKVLALALQETLFATAWGALAGALFLPLTSLWVYAILPGILLSIHFLVSMELSGSGSPLISLEIRQYTANRQKSVSRIRIYCRILLTVILFPVVLIGYVPLLFGKTSFPELFTGLRITATDRRFDPRPLSTINAIVRKASIRIRTLTIVPFAAAAAAFILLHSVPSVMLLNTAEIQDGLTEVEEELLTHYLELTALHPEELEYHVRLASLYYRNNMEQDLMNELTIIAEIDSTHAILILADTTAFTFEMLEPVPDDSSGIDLTIPVMTISDVQADSTAADSTASDSLEIQADSTELAADPDSLSLISTPADTITIFQDTIPEELPDTLSTDSYQEEIDIPAEVTEPAIIEVPETEEETVEPDTLIQP
ncbi:MAG: hypothetical protein U9P42_02695 [Candidatus Fermentibacteria bacterium]|nr:hypothetical protein [Candidatus Fermentibacteria bacterium]